MIARSLKRFRDTLGYSQEGIAGSVGMRQTTWSGWEKNPPDAMQWLVSLAKRHGVSIDYMLGLTDDPAIKRSGDGEFPERGLEVINVMKGMSPQQQEAMIEVSKIFQKLETEARESVTKDLLLGAMQYIETWRGVEAAEEFYQAISALRRTGGDAALRAWFTTYFGNDDSEDNEGQTGLL